MNHIPPGYHATRDGGHVTGPRGRLLPFRRAGYGEQLFVYVRYPGKPRSLTVALARLVCVSHHGKPPTEQHIVTHIDGDNTNVHADNLRWGMPGERREAAGTAARPAIAGDGNPGAVLTWPLVRSIREAHIQEGATRNGLARKYHVSKATIGDILHNRSWIDPDYTRPPRPPKRKWQA